MRFVFWRWEALYAWQNAIWVSDETATGCLIFNNSGTPNPESLGSRQLIYNRSVLRLPEWHWQRYVFCCVVSFHVCATWGIPIFASTRIFGCTVGMHNAHKLTRSQICSWNSSDSSMFCELLNVLWSAPPYAAAPSGTVEHLAVGELIGRRRRRTDVAHLQNKKDEQLHKLG